LLALLAVLFSKPRPRFSFPVPVPSGYGDVVGASGAATGTLDDREIRRLYNAGINNASQEELRTWMFQGADAITLVERGLARDCRVPIETTQQFAAHHSQTLGELKLLTHFLNARAALAAMEGRTNEALFASLQAYDFAGKIGEGGVAVDSLVSSACQALVLRQLTNLAPHLTPEQCSEAIKIIDQIEARTETPGVVWHRTSDWQKATFGAGLRNQEKRRVWLGIMADMWKTRSLAPLNSLPQRRLEAVRKKHLKDVNDLRRRLREQHDVVAGVTE